MKIDKIHSFLVKPEKNIDEQSEIRGTVVSTMGTLLTMLTEIFNSALSECTYEIAFQHNKNGEQQNSCKDLIVGYTNTGDFQDGLKIAEHLQNQTTKRSGLGLLFLILGSDRSKKRLVISRFPV